MNPAEIAKARRETMRWMLMIVINMSRPTGINTKALLPIIQSTYPDATHLEIRRELDYLHNRELVRIDKDPLDNWFVDLMRYGIEVVEYTCPCDPGIARPQITQA